MSRRRKVILGVSAGFVFILLAVLCLIPRDDLYEGKTVREWFDTAVNSTNVLARTQALEKFHSIGAPAVPFLITRLRGSDTMWEQRYERFWLKAPPAVRARLPLPRPSGTEQASAIALLEPMKEKAAPAVPALLHLLDSPEDTNATSTVYYFGGYRDWSQLKIEAFQALVIISPDNTNVIAAMLRQTNHSRSFLNYRLEKLSGSPGLTPAILKSKPLLRATFESGDAFQRQLVLILCRVVIASSPDLQDVVLKGMKDPVAEVQALALGAVRQMPAPDEALISAVVDALADQPFRGSEAEDPFTQGFFNTLAVDVLRQLPQDETLWQPLEKGLDHTNSGVRARCVMVLAELADAVPRFQPLIEQRLNDESQAVQYQAALVLWRMAEKPQSLVQFMVQRLGHADENQRWGAVTFLETYARGHTVVRRALEARVQMDSSFRVRARAATALGELGGDDPVMLKVLSKAAKDDEYLTVRDAAAEALAKLQAAPTVKPQ